MKSDWLDALLSLCPATLLARAIMISILSSGSAIVPSHFQQVDLAMGAYLVAWTWSAMWVYLTDLLQPRKLSRAFAIRLIADLRCRHGLFGSSAAPSTYR